MQNGEIISNEALQPGYFSVDFFVPEICEQAKPGQFVHVKIDAGGERILRRPFSIHNVTADGRLTVVYKVVGSGTGKLAEMRPGAVCDLMGPLGRPFTPPPPDTVPVLVVGGYGAAATYLLAKHAVTPGVVLLGARGAADVLLRDKYEKCGFEVRVSTNDGSIGHRGLVTDLIPPLLEELGGRKLKFYACGPHPMLIALAKIIQSQGLKGELSLDHLMCCGVGACFACVVKVRDDGPDGWRYARSCYEGPVFDANDIYTG